MSTKRPRIEGFAVISLEGMIAGSDSSFPDVLKIPADHEFYQSSLDRASAVANGRHSAEGGPKEAARRRIVLTRRVQRLMADPNNPKAVLWNPATAPFDEAWQRLGIEDGMLAVVGGTDVFGLFLNIGYDAFFLTRAQASVPRGRPVFPGVGNGTTPEEVLTKHGLVLRQSRVLDPATNTVVEEWCPKT
ncbi:MAG: dihydrofolate reductase [Reyranella sp.]|nr:dihydrofolate reductase [Reyranella sp.]MDP3159050.1 dihydrofolate reductase [Reyranella sp.]